MPYFKGEVPGLGGFYDPPTYQFVPEEERTVTYDIPPETEVRNWFVFRNYKMFAHRCFPMIPKSSK
jgi:hypothetical protein